MNLQFFCCAVCVLICVAFQILDLNTFLMEYYLIKSERNGC
jgi:hypothetical protein